MSKEADQPTKKAPEEPKLKWVDEQYNTRSAKLAHFSFLVYWEGEEEKAGYQARASMSLQFVNTFSSDEEAKLAIERAVRKHCKEMLEQLGE